MCGSCAVGCWVICPRCKQGEALEAHVKQGVFRFLSATNVKPSGFLFAQGNLLDSRDARVGAFDLNLKVMGVDFE